MSCLDNSLYIPTEGCGDCELDKDSILYALGYQEYATIQDLPDGGGTENRIIIGRILQTYPVSLAIITPPNRQNYETGDEFDPWGMVVEATLADGTTKIVDDYTVDCDIGWNNGTVPYTVSYTDRGITVSATGTIHVHSILTVLHENSVQKTLVLNEDGDNAAWFESVYGPIIKTYGRLYHDTGILWADDMADIKWVASSYATEVDNVDSWFENATNLKFADLIGIRTTSARSTFKGCPALTSASINKRVKDTYKCFMYCTALLAFSSLDFMPENINSMFQGCTSLTSVDIDCSEVKESVNVLNACSVLEDVTLDGLGTAFEQPGPDNSFSLASSTVIDAQTLYDTLQTFADISQTYYTVHIKVSSTTLSALTAIDADIVDEMLAKGWAVHT